jgi:hypothetical protein
MMAARAPPPHPLPNPPPPPPAEQQVVPPPIVDFPALQTAIINSHTVDDFVRIYDNTPFQLILRYLFVARGDNDVETWARDWAIRMRPGQGPEQPPPAANDVYLNHCRETVLLLVFTLLDRWREEGCITNVQLVERFKSHRFTNILLLAVPLDQAECLYTLQYHHHPVAGVATNHRYGMHWVAEQHVTRSVDWQQLLTQVNGRPTMNHRYLWLMEDDALAGLELSTNGELVRFLEPYRNHLLEEEDEEEDEDEEDGAMQEDF